jgi:hypothetical protein
VEIAEHHLSGARSGIGFYGLAALNQADLVAMDGKPLEDITASVVALMPCIRFRSTI